MPRYPKKPLPPGWALVEYDDGTFQTILYAGDRHSPRVTRRIRAVEWAWQDSRMRHAQEEQRQPPATAHRRWNAAGTS